MHKQPKIVDRGQSRSCHTSMQGITIPRKTALMPKIASILFMLSLCCSAFGQAARVDLPLQTYGPNVPSGAGPLPQALWLSNVSVYACVHPSASLSACQASPITTYTDSTEGTTCPSTTQLVQLPGSTCTASAGAAANVGLWYQGGIFDYWVVASYGTFGPFTYNAPAAIGGNYVSKLLTTPQTMAGPLSGPTISPSPLDYGAVGNGSTNDSAAFATAMASLSSGSTLSLNGHSYQLNTGVTVPAGVTIQGPGTLKLPSTASGVTLVTMSSAGASLKGVTLIGSSAASSLAVAIAANDATVEDNNVSGFTLAAVYLNSGLRFAIDHNTICDNQNGGIYAAPAVNGITGYGSINQNTICENTQNQGILIGGGAGNIVHFSVSNNIVYSNGSGALAGGGIWVWNPASDYVISNNTVYNNNGDGINITAPHGVISGNQSDYAAGPLADPENSGIVISSATAEDITVTGNKVRYNSGYGILITTLASHVVIAGNVALDNSQYAAGVGSGIILFTSVGYVTVTGNQVYDDQGTPTQNGIFIASLPPFTTVVGNVVHGNVADYPGYG